MTVTYTGRVANANLFVFSRLLIQWKGSIYKLMYKEMLIFCVLYALLSLTYRFSLNDDQKRVFEHIAIYCERFTNLIPLSFVLGFYVAVVVGRWWNQFVNIPWHDRVMLYVATLIDGVDETSRIIRRTLMRYLTLGSLIVFQATSVSVKKRFPTMDHIIEAGMITKTEVKLMDQVSTPHGKWWVPFVWSCNLVRAARRQGRISDNYLMKTLLDEINGYRGSLGMLYAFDWISVPLVYTQVATLAVYTFFLGCLFGRQFLDPGQNYDGYSADLFIPFFTVLQFFFYMGWLKVAEQLINPFGEDDDDFEMNWIIDRNNQISLLVTDDMFGHIPPLEKDLYFGEPPPDALPYTKSAARSMSQPHLGSTADLRVSEEGMKIVNTLETIREDVALGTQLTLPSYSATPHRVSGTPIVSPYGHHRYRHGQSLLNGLRSPPDMTTSHASRVSIQSGHESDITSQIHVPSAPIASASVVNRVTEKLGRWLLQHSSRAPDLNIGRSYNPTYATFSEMLSRQTSMSEDLNPTDGGNVGDSTSVAFATPPIPNRPHLPPLAELFSPQSMFVNDCATPTTADGSVVDLESGRADYHAGMMQRSRGRYYAHPKHDYVGHSGRWTALDHGEAFTLREAPDNSRYRSAGRARTERLVGPDSWPSRKASSVAIPGAESATHPGSYSRDEIDANDVLGTSHEAKESPHAKMSEEADPVPSPSDAADAEAGEEETTTVVRFAPDPVMTPENSRSRHESNESSNHSSAGDVEYEQPEPNQCSVNSMTPLLSDSDTASVSTVIAVA